MEEITVHRKPTKIVTLKSGEPNCPVDEKQKYGVNKYLSSG